MYLDLLSFLFQIPSLIETVLEESEDEIDPCLAKKCTANEHCCEGHVCVDPEDETADPGSRRKYIRTTNCHLNQDQGNGNELREKTLKDKRNLSLSRNDSLYVPEGKTNKVIPNPIC